MTLIPGQITRLVEVVDPRTSTWHLAAEVNTDKGLVLGALVAPANGAAGQIGFEPVPEWQGFAGAEAPRVEARMYDQEADTAETPAMKPTPRERRDAEDLQQSPGAITTSDAPVRRG